jgi:ribose-phosphate pyrophosphokinase
MRTARACQAAGAATVTAVATHALLTGNASAVLAEGALQRLVVTDTAGSPALVDTVLGAKLVVLSSSELFADAVSLMHRNGSITALLES